MRILHASDLHARAELPAAQELLVERFLSDVQAQHLQVPVDLVVFSGDLSFDGSPGALDSGRRRLLEPLRELLPGREIIIVPGNHDVDRSKIDPLQERGMRDLFVDHDTVRELLGEDAAATGALRRLDGWDALHREWCAASEPRAVPLLGSTRTFECGGHTVGVASLNTAWRSSGDEDHGHLLVGEQQLRPALEAISAADVRLVVMHHPLEWLADFDEALCRTLLEHGETFVLSGHDHDSNPQTVSSARGSAVYSRAGCLYDSREYRNSYTLLDIDPAARTARALIRRWWPARDRFGVDEEIADGGTIPLPWPGSSSALPASAVPTERVLAPIAEIVREESIIVPGLDTGRTLSIPELLIEPTFWPLPDEEARAAEELTDVKVTPLDAIQAMQESNVTILCGARSSGVTSALLWLLDSHFRAVGSRMPRYIRIDPRISVGRLGQALAPEHPQELADGQTPVLIAVDDVAPRDSRAVARLAAFIAEHRHAHFILGCHESTHQQLADALADHEGVTRMFLRPLRRRDLRALVTRVYGAESSALVRRVLTVIDSQRLPRNALNMAALVAVVAREPNLEDVNETGLFDAYVSLLLDSDVLGDIDISGMDRRQREGLLERLAFELMERGVTRFPRPDAEQFVVDFYRSVGWRTGSPAQLLDSFVERRVLISDDRGVGFRYGALRDLFAAKWMLSSEPFAARVMGDCLAYPDIIRHATGLRRNRTDLLETVGDAVRAVAGTFAADVRLGDFDSAPARDRPLLAAGLDDSGEQDPQRQRGATEEQIDELYDDLAPSAQDDDGALRQIDVSESAHPADVIGETHGLLAAVLKNSELVEDVALKAGELRTVIHGWSMLAVVLTADEEMTRGMAELLTPLLEGQDTASDVIRTAEHLASVLVLGLLSVSLQGEVGTPRLEASLIEVLDDEAFMGDTLHALFATLLCASLKLSGWATRIKTFYERHGSHPVVAELVTQWTLVRYRTEELSDTTKAALEEVLTNILVASGSSGAGGAAVVERAQRRSQVLESLRRSRLLTRRRVESLTDEETDDGAGGGAG